MTVELALTPDSRWEIDAAGLADAAHQAGFSALGIPAGLVDDAAASSFASAGLRCHELLALVVSEDAEATIAAAQTLAPAVAIMDARWVNTVFRTGLTAESTAVIKRCAAIFAEAGAGMGVEPSPLGALPTLQAGLEVVAAAGAGRAGLVLDTWHFFVGASTWADLAAVPVEQIAHVQFADAAPPESDNLWHETMQRRVMPGDGTFDLDRFASTLLEAGFDGVVSVEVLSQELRALPVPEFTRRAHDSTARYWS